MKKVLGRVFSGVATALVTPFDGGKTDYKNFERLIEYQIAHRIDALLFLGTTGESATLDEKEKHEIIDFAVKTVGGRVPVIVGTGSNCTESAVRLSCYASNAGADALLVVTPYYNKASPTGLIGHYTKIADSVETPLIIYNVPSRTGVNIPLEVYGELAEHERIVGVKEASGNISYMTRLIEKCGNRLDIYSGNDDLIIPTLALGGRGVISVISNLLPSETGDICRAFFRGNTERALSLQMKYLPLIRAVFDEVNPIPIKALLSRHGLCKEEYRLPLCPLDTEKKKRLFAVEDRVLGNL